MGIIDARAMTSEEALLEASKTHTFTKQVEVAYSLVNASPAFYQADDAAEFPGELRCVLMGKDIAVREVLTEKEVDFLREVMGRLLIGVKE